MSTLDSELQRKQAKFIAGVAEIFKGEGYHALHEQCIELTNQYNDLKKTDTDDE